MKKIICASVMVMSLYGGVSAEEFKPEVHCPYLNWNDSKKDWERIRPGFSFVEKELWTIGIKHGPAPVGDLPLFRSASKVVQEGNTRKVVCVYENDTSTLSMSSTTHSILETK